MLRILILVSTAIILIVVAFQFAMNIARFDLEDFGMLVLLIGYPSLVFFYVITTKPTPDNVTYLDLFFERRRLEEQAKIDKLKSDAK